MRLAILLAAGCTTAVGVPAPTPLPDAAELARAAATIPTFGADGALYWGTTAGEVELWRRPPGGEPAVFADLGLQDPAMPQLQVIAGDTGIALSLHGTEACNRLLYVSYGGAKDEMSLGNGLHCYALPLAQVYLGIQLDLSGGYSVVDGLMWLEFPTRWYGQRRPLDGVTFDPHVSRSARWVAGMVHAKGGGPLHLVTYPLYAPEQLAMHDNIDPPLAIAMDDDRILYYATIGPDGGSLVWRDDLGPGDGVYGEGFASTLVATRADEVTSLSWRDGTLWIASDGNLASLDEATLVEHAVPYAPTEIAAGPDSIIVRTDDGRLLEQPLP